MVKRIIRYLKGKRDVKLYLKHDEELSLPLRIVAYTYADFAADASDRKSVRTVDNYMNKIVVGWSNKMQNSVALSTAEAEFVAAAAGGKEILGLQELLGEIGSRTDAPMILRIDNQVTHIKQLENESSASSAKHIDVKLKFLKDYVHKETMKPIHVASEVVVTDLLTKVLKGVSVDPCAVM